MYERILNPPQNKSFFLFGPRATGKTTWLKKRFPDALYIDLLDAEIYNDLLANPKRLSSMIPEGYSNYVIIDEVQRVPELLYEVHRLIEERGMLFVITGSSARKLRRADVNLLAGRAYTCYFFPLTAMELCEDFDVKHSLLYGHLPSTFNEAEPKRYLESYVATYLREEVQQEGLTRSLGAFTRFLESASFSQAQVLNISAVARDCHIHQKVADNYFSILEDLLIAVRIPAFTKKAKRRVIAHSKFFYFDVGIYRTLRPKGPLDTPEEIDGAALETLVFQEIRAINHYYNLEYNIFFWRTVSGHEVDFVLYGPRGIVAIEVKRASQITGQMLSSLRLFKKEYPMVRAYLLSLCERDGWDDNIRIMPVWEFIRRLLSEIQ